MSNKTNPLENLEEELLDYVSNTPNNTNPSVVKSMVRAAADGVSIGGGAVTYDLSSVPGSAAALFHHGADRTEENIVPWEEVEEAFYNGVIRLNSDGKVGTMVSFYVYGSSRGISYSLGN